LAAGLTKTLCLRPSRSRRQPCASKWRTRSWSFMPAWRTARGLPPGLAATARPPHGWPPGPRPRPREGSRGPPPGWRLGYWRRAAPRRKRLSPPAPPGTRRSAASRPPDSDDKHISRPPSSIAATGDRRKRALRLRRRTTQHSGPAGLSNRGRHESRRGPGLRAVSQRTGPPSGKSRYSSRRGGPGPPRRQVRRRSAAAATSRRDASP
jgi:hypothetical protein